MLWLLELEIRNIFKFLSPFGNTNIHRDFQSCTGKIVIHADMYKSILSVQNQQNVPSLGLSLRFLVS